MGSNLTLLLIRSSWNDGERQDTVGEQREIERLRRDKIETEWERQRARERYKERQKKRGR